MEALVASGVAGVFGACIAVVAIESSVSASSGGVARGSKAPAMWTRDGSVSTPYSLVTEVYGACIAVIAID